MATIPSWVMTYDDLTSTVLQYLERKDTAVVNAIPTFISLAEFEIAQEIKTLGQLQVVESTMTPDNPVLQKPARWRKTVSMSVTVDGKKQPVYLRKYEYLKNYWPDDNQTDVPCTTLTPTGITGTWHRPLLKPIPLRCFTTSVLHL